MFRYVAALSYTNIHFLSLLSHRRKENRIPKLGQPVTAAGMGLAEEHRRLESVFRTRCVGGKQVAETKFKRLKLVDYFWFLGYLSAATV